MADVIRSPTNERIKRLVRLRSRRQRDRSGLFLIEGFRELTRAVDAGVAVVEVYFAPEHFLGKSEPDLLGRAEERGAALVEVGKEPFDKVSYRDRPEGLLAVARQFTLRPVDLSLPADPLLLVVEAIEKPGNLGTMLRTADAAGADAVIVCDPTTDIFNPNVVRASLGTLFTVPVATAVSEHAIDWLLDGEISIYVAIPGAGRLYGEVDYTSAVAVVVGSEQHGLSRSFREAATESIAIPMLGEIDSLNAALSAGILLYEAVRQRSA